MDRDLSHSRAVCLVAMGFLLFLIACAWFLNSSTTHHKVLREFPDVNKYVVHEVDLISLTKDPMAEDSGVSRTAKDRAVLLIAVSLFAILGWWIVVFKLTAESHTATGFPSVRALRSASLLIGFIFLLIVAVITDLPPFDSTGVTQPISSD
jgi:heme A synthase